MSDQNPDSLSILLPQASVDVFTLTDKTAKVVKSLEDDWRFSRVTVHVEEGGLDAALNKYNISNSANLVLIETDDIGDAFIEELEKLSNYCSEGTSAIVLGPVNDVNLYRSLVGMGISDYLVHPLEKEAFANVLAGTLIDRMGVSESNLIVVDGSKGGVGASSIAHLLASGVSETIGMKTMSVDAAGGMTTLPVAFGFEPATTLPEIVSVIQSGDDEGMKRLIHTVSDQLHVLASGNEPLLEEAISSENFETILDQLLAVYPVVIADVSNAAPRLKMTALSRAHKVILVTTPVIGSLRHCRTKISEIKALRGGQDDVIELVVNKSGMIPAHEVPDKDIKEALETEPSLILKWEPGVFCAAESKGMPIQEMKGADKLTSSVLGLVKNLVGQGEGSSDKPKEGLLSKLLGKGS